ncbi:hypothetical protein [Streptomyces chartreusis]|uniref:Uncharacterized protein n=1 Tax=Streptomyces chartreusis TaxID=1969 RepID=A0A7H8T554_STRCX|nr:hypothetical protein [Streptomyces chartreusis]QKZ18611.1 hypothetical protein HUT05_15270 [Streptomyces chartreusis]
MSARRLRTAALLLAAVPVTAAAAAVALKAGHWRMTCSRHGIRLEPLPRPDCPDCRGAGGWWTSGPYPDIRRELYLRLLPYRTVPYDEPPF